jgi:hypothetical protein
MAAIDFPNSPTVGQTFTVGDTTWEWNGTTWKSLGTVITGEANFSSFLLAGA